MKSSMTNKFLWINISGYNYNEIEFMDLLKYINNSVSESSYIYILRNHKIRFKDITLNKINLINIDINNINSMIFNRCIFEECEILF